MRRIRLRLVVQYHIVFSMRLYVANRANLNLRTRNRFQRLLTMLNNGFQTFQTKTSSKWVAPRSVRRLKRLIRPTNASSVTSFYSTIILITNKRTNSAVLFNVRPRKTRLRSLGLPTVLDRARLLMRYQTTVQFSHGNDSRRRQARGSRTRREGGSVRNPLSRRVFQTNRVTTSARRKRVRRIRQPYTTRSSVTRTKSSRRISTLASAVFRGGVSLITISATSGGDLRTVRGA